MKTEKTKTARQIAKEQLDGINLLLFYYKAQGIFDKTTQSEIKKSIKNSNKPICLRIIYLVKTQEKAHYLKSILNNVGSYKKVRLAKVEYTYQIIASKNILIDSLKSELLYLDVLAKSEGSEFFSWSYSDDKQSTKQLLNNPQ